MRGTSGTLRFVYIHYDIVSRERERTFFFRTRQSGNAYSVCLLSVPARLWGAIRHGTGEKSVLQRRITFDLSISRFLLNSLSAVAFLTVRAHRRTKFARIEDEIARRREMQLRNRKLLGKMMMIETRIPCTMQ